MFIYVSISNAYAMAENIIDWIRLMRVSQTAFVRRERIAARTTGPWFVDNSFEIASTLQPRGSYSSGSRSRLSLAYDAMDPEVPEALEAHEETNVYVHL